MDLPQPPQDTELRNIIDKLAQFVARNGPEFEQMTKSKQKGNPKFQFLYGGEYYNYYQYRVNTEQATVLRQGTMNNQNTPLPQPNWNQNNVAPNSNIDQILQQQENLKEQIMQSEQNLSAQHAVLLQQQQANVESTVNKLEMEALSDRSEKCGVDLESLSQVLQPIIELCTKDSISNGKAWILQHSLVQEQADCVAQYLLLKVIQGIVPFPQKLHIVYLVNDVLHHCARKHADELKKSLENVVVPMFCNASIGATDEQRNKLDRLLKLWESKANYLNSDTVEKLRQPAVSYQQYQSRQVSKYGSQVNMIIQQTKATFDGYQAQHQAFVSHAMQQILNLEQQRQTIDPNAPPIQPILTQTISIEPISNPVATISPNIASNVSIPPNLTSNLPVTPNITSNIPVTPNLTSNLPVTPNITGNIPVTQNLAGTPSSNNVPEFHLPPPLMTNNGMECGGALDGFNQPPPGLPSFLPGGFPDFSKPPPGFTPKQEVEELMPSVPYYDLPAGLMIPLIKLDDDSYKSIDPDAIRLPPPAPPSDRLLAAVEAFYAIPSHERPRDSEGWEKLGLYEYYKAKNNARKLKEVQMKLGLRPKSKSPSPIDLPYTRSQSPPKRRYQSKSPSPQPQTVDRRKSRSRSPVRKRRKNKRRRSDSRSKSRSRSPPREAYNRSPTPPSSINAYMKSDNQEIDESNKGHQMLRKMGWGGSGLGAKEQGIDAPISEGEVKDRQDLYKGVGMALNDPYENFRKHKGAAYITRMKARAEEERVVS